MREENKNHIITLYLFNENTEKNRVWKDRSQDHERYHSMFVSVWYYVCKYAFFYLGMCEWYERARKWTIV